MRDYIWDDTPIEAGDVVIFVSKEFPSHDQFTYGEAYLISHLRSRSSVSFALDDRGSITNGWITKHFRKVKTYAGKTNLVYDFSMYIGENPNSSGIGIAGCDGIEVGKVYQVKPGSTQRYIYWNHVNQNNRYSTEFLIIGIHNNTNNKGDLA